MDSESENLRRALRRLPVPEPRSGFVDRALRKATAAAPPSARVAVRPSLLRQFATRWETWIGAALGAAVAVAVTVMVLRPVSPNGIATPSIALALNEAREVDVLIDSERDLEGAIIRVAVTGGVTLDGFDNERQLQWQADLRRGSNLLSLPVVARSAGQAQLVAVVEHDGRTRRVRVDLVVKNSEVSKS